MLCSHRPHHPLENLLFAHTPTLDQARHHRDIAHEACREIPVCFPERRMGRGAGFTRDAFAVWDLLLRLAFLGRVVGDATLDRTLPAMRLSASQWTPQVAPPGVTRMRQEENPAMPTPAQTSPQVGSRPQHRPQHHVILLHQSAHFALAVPIGTELEMLLDFNYDKPSVSVIIRMFSDTSLSYPIDASVSRG
jgi:hypothetical protein